MKHPLNTAGSTPDRSQIDPGSTPDHHAFHKKQVLIDVFRGSSRSKKMRLEKCFLEMVLKSKMDGIKPSLGPSKGRRYGGYGGESPHRLTYMAVMAVISPMVMVKNG